MSTRRATTTRSKRMNSIGSIEGEVVKDHDEDEDADGDDVQKMDSKSKRMKPSEIEMIRSKSNISIVSTDSAYIASPNASMTTSPVILGNLLSPNNAAPSTTTSSLMSGTNPSTFNPGTVITTAVYDKNFNDAIENPKPQVFIPPTGGDRLILVMVGLPGSGKTYIAKRIAQYLSFFHGCSVETFNLGNSRRQILSDYVATSWFDPFNEAVKEEKQMIRDHCLNALKEWINIPAPSSVTKVAIYDGSNHAQEEREYVLSQLEPLVESRRHVVFIESVVKDVQIMKSILARTVKHMPDFQNITPEKATQDYLERIELYRKNYTELSADLMNGSMSFIRVSDIGRCVSLHRIRGYIVGRAVQFLLSLRPTVKSVYLVRHGESEYNVQGKIGGDSSLTPSGIELAKRLGKFVTKNILGLEENGTIPETKKNTEATSSSSSSSLSLQDPTPTTSLRARLLTSSLKRSIETAKFIPHPVCSDGWIVMRPRVWRNLDELYAGIFDGMTYDDIREKVPEQFEEREKEKLTYRYPRGESYLDVIERLDPVIHELESFEHPALVVGHQGTLRILYAYFTGLQREQATTAQIPINVVIKLTPQTYGCDEERIVLLEPVIDPNSH